MTNTALHYVLSIYAFSVFVVTPITGALNTDQTPTIVGSHFNQANGQNGDVIEASDANAEAEQIQNEANRSQDDYGYGRGDQESSQNGQFIKDQRENAFYECVSEYTVDYCQYLAEKLANTNEDNSVYAENAFSEADYVPLAEDNPDKRRLRFVKRRLRFVKKDFNEAEDEDRVPEEKRRLRFIKKSRDDDEKVKGSPAEKRRLRFVKKSSDEDESSPEKRRLRFVKKSQDLDNFSADKRRLRFVKKNEKRRLRFIKKDNAFGDVYSNDRHPDESSEAETREDDNISTDKRRLRFIKRDSEFHLDTEDIPDIPGEKGNSINTAIVDPVSDNGHNNPLIAFSLKSKNTDGNVDRVFVPHKIQRRSTPITSSVLARFLDSMALEKPVLASKRANSIAMMRSLVGADVAKAEERKLMQRMRDAGKRSSPTLQRSQTINTGNDVDDVASNVLAALLNSYIMSRIDGEALSL